MASIENYYSVRQQQKIDTKENWEKIAGSFQPLNGEIIIYSDIKNIKIGDGENLLAALDFILPLDSFGWGEREASLGEQNADDCKTTGLYRCHDGTPNDNPYLVFTLSYDASNIHQTAYALPDKSSVSEVTMAHRHYHNGQWSGWRSEDPTMAQGIEYATFENWHGKVVYSKLLYRILGANNQILDTDIESSYIYPVYLSCIACDQIDKGTPYTLPNAKAYVDHSNNIGKLKIDVGEKRDIALDVMICVRYIKENPFNT